MNDYNFFRCFNFDTDVLEIDKGKFVLFLEKQLLIAKSFNNPLFPITDSPIKNKTLFEFFKMMATLIDQETLLEPPGKTIWHFYRTIVHASLYQELGDNKQSEASSLDLSPNQALKVSEMLLALNRDYAAEDKQLSYAPDKSEEEINILSNSKINLISFIRSCAYQIPTVPFTIDQSAHLNITVFEFLEAMSGVIADEAYAFEGAATNPWSLWRNITLTSLIYE